MASFQQQKTKPDEKTKIKPTDIVPENTWWQIYKYLTVILKKPKELKEDTEKIKKKVHDQNRSISEDRGNLTPPPNKMKIGAEKYSNWNEIFSDGTQKLISGEGKKNQQKVKGQYELPNLGNRK